MNKLILKGINLEELKKKINLIKTTKYINLDYILNLNLKNKKIKDFCNVYYHLNNIIIKPFNICVKYLFNEIKKNKYINIEYIKNKKIYIKKKYFFFRFEK